MTTKISSKLTLIVTILTVAAVVVAGFFWLRNDSLVEKVSGTDQGKISNHPSSMSFDIDGQQIFEVKMHSDVRIDENSAAGVNSPQARQISLDLVGVLEIVTVERRADLWKILMRFSPGLKISFNQGDDHSTEQQLTDTVIDLSRGMLLSLRENGNIAEFSHTEGTDRFAEQLLRQVAASFQFHWSDSVSARNWKQIEIDGSGTYQADYKVDSEEGGTIKATKVKSGYLAMGSLASGGGAPALRGGLSGQVQFHLDHKTGWPRQIDGQESASVTVGELPQQMASVANTKYSFRFINRHLLTHAQVTSWWSDIELSSSNVRREKGDSSQLKNYARDRLGKTKLSEIENEIRKFGDKTQTSNANQERVAYDRLVAYVRVNDDNLVGLRETLKGREAKDIWLQQTLSALAYVGCSECQSTLVDEVMVRSADPDFSTNLLSLLSQPQDPSSSVEQALRRLTKSSDSVVRSMAQLGLGTVSHNLKNTDQNRAELIAADFVSEFRQASTTEGKLVALAVLGNSGSLRVVDVASPLLESSEESIRIAAVNALRNVSTPAASEAVLKKLSDPSALVRQNVVRVIAQQPRSQASCETLARHVQNEPVASVRAALIRQLGEYYQTNLIAKAAIERQAKVDPDSEVRVLAENTVIMYSPR